MSPILIDGKEISRQVIAEIARETSEFMQSGGRKPQIKPKFLLRLVLHQQSFALKAMCRSKNCFKK
jgi:5,10-methylene-tetrahydrofolate dehydrogenase/methenyl tetrahydrofolate cyclohydrolase